MAFLTNNSWWSLFVAYNGHHVLEDDEEGVVTMKKNIYTFVNKRWKDPGDDALGCRWNNKSHTHLLKGLLLGEYFLKYFHKVLKKPLKFFIIKKYYYFKFYIKYFKKMSFSKV